MVTSSQKLRNAPIAVLASGGYTAARQEAQENFRRNSRVEPLWRALSQAADTEISASLENKGLTAIAVGGYGRRELYPFSDIDLLILIEARTLSHEAQATAFLQALWEKGLRVSHATRTSEETLEAARAHHTIATALLDMRHIAGDPKATRDLKKKLAAEVFGQKPADYSAAKLEEREVRHAKWGDSRLMLEPHIKEGKGALRDLDTLRWIADYCGKPGHAVLTAAEWRTYREARLFFANLRAQMHAIRGKADERLTFDLQMEIAARLKFKGRNAQQKAERLMQRYFQYTRQVGTLTRIFCAGLELNHVRQDTAPTNSLPARLDLPPEFFLEEGKLDFTAPEALPSYPSRAVSIFYLASMHDVEIHARAYLALTRALPILGRRLMFEGEANRLFFEMLLTAQVPALHLRRMNEAGILSALIPEFARITGMMQYDGYHTYTVDEHTLTAIGNLALIMQGAWTAHFPLASRVIHEIEDRAPLYLAVLCHDLAKGTGGKHAEKGEILTARITKRMGLNARQGEEAAWLVKHQELMSMFAFKRNLEDTQTIADFVGLVQSPERLRLLLLLTVCDIKAVGPAIWNGWKGALIRALYQQASAAMETTTSPRSALEALPPAALHAYRLWQENPVTAAIAITHDRFLAISEITCCTAYHHQVFRNLAGVLAYLGASIVTARIQVMEDKAALMTIGIQDIAGNSFADEDRRLQDLPMLLAKAEQGALDFARELPKRRKLSEGREVSVKPAVFIDNGMSGEASVIEVSARDRLGLLYDILGGIEDAALQIVSAQLATYGKKAVDVFYVKDTRGHKITEAAKLAEIERSLLAVLARPVQDGAT